MVNEKAITVVFDTRSADFGNGQQYQSLIDQVNTLLQSGKSYREIEITQWQIYHEGEVINQGEENIHIPFYRHFYHDPKKNTFGGGFMVFEVLEDLRRHYGTSEVTDNIPDDFELVFTVTVGCVS